MKLKLKLLFLLLFSAGCATHTQIEPAGTGKTNAYVNFGGPIIEAFGTSIPVPYLSAGYDHGLTNRLNYHANLHLVPFAYQLAGLDFGATYFPVINDGLIPTIGITGNINAFYSFKSSVTDRFRLYPVLTPSFAWELWGGKIYTGADLVLKMTKNDYSDVDPSVYISPILGYKWNLGNEYHLFTEMKWNAINAATNKNPVSYFNPGNTGAIGVYISVERSL